MQSRYYYSLVGFRAIWHTDFVIALYLCALIAASRYSTIGGDISLWGFVVLVLVLVIGAPLHMRRPSPLVSGQKRIAEFDISGINWHLNLPVSVAAYEDSIEFKIYFDSFLVPYTRITSGPSEVGMLVKSTRLMIDVPGLPKKLTIHGNRRVREALSELIRSRLKLNSTSIDRLGW